MKTKAHQIGHEPEALKEDIFVYKQILKQKKKLNEELKEKHRELEEENLKYEDFIQRNQACWNANENSDSKLLVSLKKKEKELLDVLKQKQLEYDDAIRSVKNTRLKEMDCEIEELEEESKRLGAMLAEIMQGPNAYDSILLIVTRIYSQKQNKNTSKRQTS